MLPARTHYMPTTRLVVHPLCGHYKASMCVSYASPRDITTAQGHPLGHLQPLGCAPSSRPCLALTRCCCCMPAKHQLFAPHLQSAPTWHHHLWAGPHTNHTLACVPPAHCCTLPTAHRLGIHCQAATLLVASVLLHSPLRYCPRRL